MKDSTKKEAIAVFKKYPLANEVFITSDDQAFLKKDRAQLHDKEFVSIKRSDVMEAKPVTPEKKQDPIKPTAEELIKSIQECKTLLELDVFVKGEKRATVLDALKKQRELLTPVKK